MIRVITEAIEFSDSDIELIINFRNLLEDFMDFVKKEDAFPTLSDTYLDTEHLLKTLNDYLDKYCS